MAAITLTPKQVLAIYKAGIERGADEATAYDWGCHPTGSFLDPLENAMVWSKDFDIVPADYDAKKAWWAAYVEELNAPAVPGGDG
jgi:hypothetical protein